MERMTRTQIMLEPRQHSFIASEAASRGVSVSALVREIIDAHMEDTPPSSQGLMDLAGIITQSDFSGRDHDDILYGSRG
jgi:hypothetical protein